MSSQILPILSESTQYKNYFTDEAKYKGFADSISFPENETEIKDILKILSQKNIPVTIQSGKTGIVGGAIPKGGHLMNLSRMNRVLDMNINKEKNEYYITVQPGINLMDLDTAILNVFPEKKYPKLFWPPQPTETSATVGGIASTNAQGISAYYYGESKKYIQKVKWLDYSGNTHTAERNKEFIEFEGKKYDVLNLVLGKEGILGIIVELTLILKEKPKFIWGLTFFFDNKTALNQFAENLQKTNYNKDKSAVITIEYMDNACIKMVQSQKRIMEKLKFLPDIDDKYTDIIYVEIISSANNEDEIEEIAGELMDVAAKCGCDIDNIWALAGENEVIKMRNFRHAVSEIINVYVEKACLNEKIITKLSTDMAIDKLSFAKVCDYYRDTVNKYGLKGYIFGHIMHNHLHLNIVAENKVEYLNGIEAIKQLADFCIDNKGILFCEHGIGKLKKEILQNKLPNDYLRLCRFLKDKYDAGYMINKNNILSVAGTK